jgi:pyruvate dehydrogenase E1 component alpha subunit
MNSIADHASLALALSESAARTKSAIVSDREWARRAGYWLHLIWAVEERGLRIYLQGQLPGSFYDGRGQEATSVGVAMAMLEDDIASPLIRDMGVHLVRGVSPAEMMRHYLGKTGAPMNGRDGNIHLGALDRGTVPRISHLPETLPVGLGIAVSRRRRTRFRGVWLLW